MDRHMPTDCYAAQIRNDAQAPRYRRGEWVLVSPAKEIKPGREVVIKLKTGELLLKTFDPKVRWSNVESIHAVIGRADEFCEAVY